MTPDPKPLNAPPPVQKRRRGYFQASLVFLIIAFTFLALFAKNYPYFVFDLPITLAIQRISWPYFNNLMVTLSQMGDFPLAGIIFLIAGVFLIVIRKVRDIQFLILSTIGAVAISIILKFLVARPRPDPTLIHQITAYKIPDSFPSGHVLFFMGFWGYLLFVFYSSIPRGALRTTAIWICLTMLILIGISRIYLGAHWFSDTLGAYIVGLVWLLTMVSLRRRFS